MRPRMSRCSETVGRRSSSTSATPFSPGGRRRPAPSPVQNPKTCSSQAWMPAVVSSAVASSTRSVGASRPRRTCPRGRLARSTSGKATACPASGSTPLGQSGRSTSLAHRKCLLSSACLKGDSLSAMGPMCQRPVMVARGLARLHLEHEQTMLGMGDDRVRLPVARRAVDAHGPGPPDVGVEAVVARGQGGPQACLDVALGVLSAGHGARMSLDAAPTYPSGVRYRLGQMRRKSHQPQRR